MFRVKRIFLLVCFFVALVSFVIDDARINLVFMTFAIGILVWVKRPVLKDPAVRQRHPTADAGQRGNDIGFVHH